MFSPRLGFLLALSAVAACGGKIDDGSDSGVDSGVDSPSPPPLCQPPGGSCSVTSDCCSSTCVGGVCVAPPPCTPDYVTCSTSSECCSQICDAHGYCTPNTPPPCEPDGAGCGSSSQCCSQVCNGGGTCGAPPPPCHPYGAPCGSNSQCCSQVCSGGQCSPTSWCNGNGATCASASECCSNVCTNSLCGGIALDAGPLCGSTSGKLCDQCLAQNCCIPEACCLNMAGCGVNDSVCSPWLTCVQSCELKGHSAFWCTQNVCGSPASPLETSLYNCAQQDCATQCTKD